MLKTTTFDNLFATPFMAFHMSDWETLNPELLEEGARLRSTSKGLLKSNQDGWHSEGNLFLSDVQCLVKVRNAAQNAVAEMTRKVSSSDSLDKLNLSFRAWMNITPSGGYNAPHSHPGAHWSGVYYVSQPDVEEGTSGMIEFLDPRSDLQNWRKMRAKTFATRHRFRPPPGTLVLFPSYLLHWVHPNRSDEERVSIAFNATIKT